MITGYNSVATSKNIPNISVIIPTINEEESIGDVVSQLKAELKDYKYEIIVVDRSIDKTPQIAKSKGAIVLQQEKKGYGNALLQGFSAAKGDIIVMMDGDNTYDPKDIRSLISPILKGEADIVLGNRFARMEKGAMTSLNKIGNKILTFLTNFLIGANVADSQTGYRAMLKKAIFDMNLYEEHMPFATEMIFEAKREGLLIKNVPISYRIRKGKTKLNSLRDGVDIILTSLRLIRDYNPLLVFGSTGFILVVVGFYFGMETINYFNQTGVVYVGRALLSVSLSVIGILSIFTGLILDSIKSYLSKNYYK